MWAEVMQEPEMKKALEARSFVVEATGPKAFKAFIADENVKWQKVIKDANIHID